MREKMSKTGVMFRTVLLFWVTCLCRAEESLKEKLAKLEAGYTEVYESVFGLYYIAQIVPWMAIGPSLQFVDNLVRDNEVDESFVFGLRAQTSF